METRPQPQEAPKPEAPAATKPVVRPRLVVLTTDDTAVRVCNLEGECA